MFNSKIQPPLNVGITSQLLREVERLEDEDGEATEAPWRYPHWVSSTLTLSICISGDNTVEHLALFTFSHLMQTESPFHNKWSPFFPESPFHQTPDPLWTEDHRSQILHFESQSWSTVLPSDISYNNFKH